ncbi:hypothetical protein VH571_15210 [Frondihabitans sp. 4ASC-45]|uniref:hypothetical protein n=1 Tax=Frondihabitans sp. 4ASC-45 TaxID=3111636 RepID=UPI003C297129
MAPLALATGVLGAVLLSASMTGTLSGFAASITNSQNTAATGSLVMQEQSSGTTPVTCLSTDGGTISTNTATCSTINKFGGSTTMIPGQTVTSTVTIKNTGTVAANTFTLTPGTSCTQSNNGAANGSATDLCAKLNVVITNTTAGTTVYSGTATALAGSSAITLPAAAAGASTGFTFAVTLASTAGNTYQGLQASLPLTWAYAS